MENQNPTQTDPTPVSEIADAVNGVMDRIDASPVQGGIRTDAEHETVRRLRELSEAETTLWRERGCRYSGCRLATFRTDTPNQDKVKAILQTYAEHAAEHIDEGTGIILVGPPGTGKDHLLSAMIRAAFRRGKLCKWTSGPGLFATLRDDINGSTSEEDRVREYTQPDVLIISDPMPVMGGLKEFQAAKLYEIIDARYNNRRAVWASINAHDRAEADSRIGQAIMDRLVDGAITLTCDWASFRQAKRN